LAKRQLKIPGVRDFSYALPRVLIRAREATMRYFRPLFDKHNLTEQQWRVLRALADGGPYEVTELSRITYLLPPSLSRILRDLRLRGLVERAVGTEDQRRSVISISRKGVALIAELAPALEAAYVEIESRFGVLQLETLKCMLLDLEAALLADEVTTSSFRKERE
jgi:homoprotocatechuate degradation regulator HpaR